MNLYNNMIKLTNILSEYKILGFPIAVSTPLVFFTNCTVVKKSNTMDHPNLSFDLNIINDKLYIAGSRNMITEALILIYIRKLWHKTVHLPLIFAYGTCSNKKIVNKIITLKFGLPDPVEINLDGKIYNEKSLYTHKKQIDIIKNNISTLRTQRKF